MIIFGFQLIIIVIRRSLSKNDILRFENKRHTGELEYSIKTMVRLLQQAHLISGFVSAQRTKDQSDTFRVC